MMFNPNLPRTGTQLERNLVNWKKGRPSKKDKGNESNYYYYDFSNI